MNRKFLVIAIVLLAFGIAIVILYLKMPLSKVEPIPTSFQDRSILTASSIHPSLDWEEVDENDPNSLYAELKDVFLYQNGQSKTLSLEGHEWKALSSDFLDLYEITSDFFEKKGWSTSLDIDGDFLQPIVADSPTGSIWSYIREEDGSIEIVVISDLSLSKVTGEVSTDCPCDYEYRIFISEPLPVEKVLKGN